VAIESTFQINECAGLIAELVADAGRVDQQRGCRNSIAGDGRFGSEHFRDCISVAVLVCKSADASHRGSVVGGLVERSSEDSKCFSLPRGLERITQSCQVPRRHSPIARALAELLVDPLSEHTIATLPSEPLHRGEGGLVGWRQLQKGFVGLESVFWPADRVQLLDTRALAQCCNSRFDVGEAIGLFVVEPDQRLPALRCNVQRLESEQRWHATVGEAEHELEALNCLGWIA
jgi:hypothetical protein